MHTFIINNVVEWNSSPCPLQFDQHGYYLYLPATIVHHDVCGLQFFPTKQIEYGIQPRTCLWGISQHPNTGCSYNKYPVGVALFEAPLFLVAHAYCLFTHTYKADGYSVPYIMSVYYTYVLLTFFALLLLRLVLLRYYADRVVGITLLLLAFGSNLYFYTVFSPGMAHPVAFLLFAALLYACERYYRERQSCFAIAIAALLALIVVVRPSNIVGCLIPLFYGYVVGMSPKVLWAYWRTHGWQLLMGILAFALIASIQLFYWQYTTGQWLFYSYQSEGFDFLHPHLYEGLLSYRKGWLVYTPLAAVCMVGIIALARTQPRMAMLIAAYLFINIWVVFSWREWNYGGSFGCRPLIESFAFLSLPLAAIVNSVANWNSRLLKSFATAFAVLLVSLNLLQSYQIKHTALPWDGTTRETYWKVFGKLPEH